MQLNVCPHLLEGGSQHPLYVEGARCEILEEPPDHREPAGALGKEGYRDQGEGQHGSGPRRPDIPLEVSVFQRLSRSIDDLPRTHMVPFQSSVGEKGARTDCLQVLGPESRIVPLRPDPDHVQRLFHEGSQRHSMSEQGSASRIERAIDLDHNVLIDWKRAQSPTASLRGKAPGPVPGLYCTRGRSF